MKNEDYERRDHNGLHLVDRRPNGRTRVSIECPFCGEDVVAYIWSLCGSGKRCPCGAILSPGSYLTQVDTRCRYTRDVLTNWAALRTQ